MQHHDFRDDFWYKRERASRNPGDVLASIFSSTDRKESLGVIGVYAVGSADDVWVGQTYTEVGDRARGRTWLQAKGTSPDGIMMQMSSEKDVYIVKYEVTWVDDIGRDQVDWCARFASALDIMNEASEESSRVVLSEVSFTNGKRVFRPLFTKFNPNA